MFEDNTEYMGFEEAYRQANAKLMYDSSVPELSDDELKLILIQEDMLNGRR